MSRRLFLVLGLLLLTGGATAFGRDFFAVVDRLGGFVRGNPGTTTVHNSPGQVEVTFNADVSGCSFTASIGDPETAPVNSPGLIFTAAGHLSSNGVYVITKTLGGAFTDYPFHLSVACTFNYAVVNAAGSLVRGDAQSVTRLNAGQYEVTFGIPVNRCGYTATIGDPGNSLISNTGLIFTAGGHSSPNGIYIETKTLTGGLADYPFHLSAACASTYAVVNGQTLVRGDAQSVNQLGVGLYEITFAVPVDECGYTATIGDPANGAVAAPGLVFVTGDSNTENGVHVETKELGGAASNFPFHLRVTCPLAFGFADLHTHPATHLAFGADRQNGVNGPMWGKPAHDGALDLTTSSEQANLATDLGPCPSASVGPIGLGFTHNNAAGPDFVKLETDAQIVSSLDNTSPGWLHQAEGWPSFGSPQAGWPAALTVNHQVMHINNIKRAFDGGLRLLFAAATDDELISGVWNQGFNLLGNAAPSHHSDFDYNSAVIQLTYITNLVNANNSWMQIVWTPEDARAAIASNPPKLAVVLSLEMDSLSVSQIQALVHQFHVAHVIPVHLADNNSFGGTAIYSDIFNGLSNFINGSFLQPEDCNLNASTRADCNNVNFSLGTPAVNVEPVTLSTILSLSSGKVAALDIALVGAAAFGPGAVADVASWAALLAIGIQIMPTGALGYQASAQPNPQPIQVPGQINSRDLNQDQFTALMNMGLLLDVAHMGQKTAGTALALAKEYNYPLMDSHTGIRCDLDCTTPFGSPPNPSTSQGAVVNERSIPTSHVSIIKQLGGVIGMGVVPSSGSAWFAQDLFTFTNAVPVGPGSAMTSWVQSDGPHVVYADAAGHVRQLWYTVASGQWATQDLTTVPNAVPAGPGSAITSWVQSDGPHVVYADAAGHVRQLWYTVATGQWAAQDLTTVPNAAPAGPGRAMTSCEPSDGPHLVYVDANGHLRQLWYSILIRAWFATDLTTSVNVPPIGPGSGLTSWAQSDGPHFVYADANAHVQHLWYTIATGQWASRDLTALGNAVPAGQGSAITSWVQSDGPHFVYIDANGHFQQLLDNIFFGLWIPTDVTAATNATPAGPGSAITSWAQSDGPHVAYADANGHVRQLWFTLATGKWAAQDLTTVPNALPEALGSGMSSWVDSGGAHVVYADANGHVRHLLYTIAPDPDPVTTWIKNYSIAFSLMGGRGLALGTDADGLSPMIQRDTIPTNYPITVASDFGCLLCPSLPNYRFGVSPLGNRTYDFEVDGIANYGLLPDFIQAASQARPSQPAPTAQIAALFSSAEDTIEMWEKVQTAALGVPAPGLPLAGNGSGMTSWVQSNDGPHSVYADANGHVRQLWYTVATGQWAAQDLAVVLNAAPAGTRSGMTSWVQSNDGPHVVYADASGHVRQLWYTLATGQWAAQDLTTVPNAVPAGPGSAMTSWVQSNDGPHVVYADANGHVRQLWYTIATGQWAAQDLTTVPNAVPAGPGSAMTSWVQSNDGPHVVYADANGHVRQLWYTVATGQWAAQDLTTVPNAVPAGTGSGMTSWVQSNDGPHVVYADANGHVRQLWYTVATGQWAAQDLTTVPNAVPAGTGSGMTSWVQSNDGPHAVYADTNGHVRQLWYTVATGQWAAQDLTTVPNAVPAGTGSALTSWVQSNDGPHFVYADASGHVRQLWYTIATGQWAAQDLTSVQ